MPKYLTETSSTTNTIKADKIIGGTMSLKFPDDAPVVWMT
jgi:hypothetical protein